MFVIDFLHFFTGLHFLTGNFALRPGNEDNGILERRINPLNSGVSHHILLLKYKWILFCVLSLCVLK